MKEDWFYIRWAILESLVRIIIASSIILFLSNYLKGIFFILTGALLVWWVFDHLFLMFNTYRGWKSGFKTKKRK